MRVRAGYACRVSAGWKLSGPTQMRYATWTGTSSGLPGGPYTLDCDLNCSVNVAFTALGATETWTPSGPALDWKGHVMPVKLLPGYSLTKVKSVTGLSAVRRGTKVTLTASATYYSPGLQKYVRSHGRMLLMYQDLGKPWRTLTYVTPNSSGLATYTITTNRARTYQAYLPSTATTWYSYSPAVLRWE